MIRGVMFASCYVYSPCGAGAICERSRLLREWWKGADARFIPKYAGRVRQQAIEGPQLHGFFGANDLLVPIPGNAPKASGAKWVASDLAQALLREGIGKLVWPGLRRIFPVRKSATADTRARPSVALHYESFLLERPLVAPESVLLIDDVVTRGRTLLAAAARVHEAFPDARIRAFALLRTMGFVPEIYRLLDPCTGEIRWNAGDAWRWP
jgi:hypothetical protein